jgi:uncharacterized protein (UPF0303 family)
VPAAYWISWKFHTFWEVASNCVFAAAMNGAACRSRTALRAKPSTSDTLFCSHQRSSFQRQKPESPRRMIRTWGQA